MTEASLIELAIKWDQANPDDDPAAAGKYGSLLDRLDWFGRTTWARYLPADHPDWSPRYFTRLANWIGNVDDAATQQLLLRYAERIAFFSHADFGALYRTALEGPITRWVLDHLGLQLGDPTFQETLREQLHRHTWFCPVTDSMNISEFYHCNHLTGISHRPCFATLEMLAKPLADGGVSDLAKNLRAFVASPNPRKKALPIERLVLLEDFVGSGSQSLDAVAWAVAEIRIPILFVPLVICPVGLAAFENLAAKHSGVLAVAPIVSVGPADILGPKRAPQHGGADAASMEQFARDSHPLVSGKKVSGKKPSRYGPFGWEDTGCSVATFSNTPNNTLPLVHQRPASGKWTPLFPRAARV